MVPIKQIMNGFKGVNREIVIIGGGATGCDVACHLVYSGAKVTILEQNDRICQQVESITRKVMIKTLQQEGVQIHVKTSIIAIDNYGVSSRIDNEQKFFYADHVVICTGNRATDDLLCQLKSAGYNMIHVVGDCRSPRSAKEAIYEGTKAGMYL